MDVDLALAIATVLLAVFTAALAVATVSLAHRPVLVPMQRQREVRFRGGAISAVQPHVVENPRDREDLPRFSAVFLSIENVGMGPALNVRGDFRGPRGSGSVRYPAEGIGAGGEGVVAFESWQESLSFTGDDVSVEAVMLYDDVAGLTYRTRLEFVIGDNAFRAQVDGPLESSAAGGT
jgi:hypothetical protein